MVDTTFPRTGRAIRPFESLATNPVWAAAIVLLCLAHIVLIAIQNPYLGSAWVIVDFDAFYVVGLMIHDGRLAEAYHFPTMLEAYRHYAGTESFMPWTYPPQFDLIAALLPLLPRGLAYLLFVGATFAGYAWVLWRLAGPASAMVLTAMLPVLFMMIGTGQNGFLTAALVGWMCLSVIEGRRLAGVPLGLLAIKPHLGLGLGIWVLATRRWTILIQALAVAILGAVLATLAFGTDIWGAFRAGVGEAAEFLALGVYPFYRMTSLYAGLHRLGVDPALALALQTCLALAACGVVVWAVRRGLPLRHALAAACAASLLISPYTYDYDMTLLGVALALVARDLLARTSLRERLAMLLLVWLGSGWGLLLLVASLGTESPARDMELMNAHSVGAPLLVVAMILAARALLRRPADRVSGAA